jgi:hypothetical protein
LCHSLHLLQAPADLAKVALTKQTFINGLATLGAKVRHRFAALISPGCAAQGFAFMLQIEE